MVNTKRLFFIFFISGCIFAGFTARPVTGYAYTLHGEFEDPDGLFTPAQMKRLQITADLPEKTTLVVSPDERGLFRITASLPILQLSVRSPDKKYYAVKEGPWLKDTFIQWEIEKDY